MFHTLSIPRKIGSIVDNKIHCMDKTLDSRHKLRSESQTNIKRTRRHVLTSCLNPIRLKKINQYPKPDKDSLVTNQTTSDNCGSPAAERLLEQRCRATELTGALLQLCHALLRLRRKRRSGGRDEVEEAVGRKGQTLKDSESLKTLKLSRISNGGRSYLVKHIGGFESI